MAIEVAEGDMRIRLEKTAPSCAAEASVLPSAALASQTPAQRPGIEEQTVDFNHIKEVRSPMVGVFYAAPGPELPPYVKVGSQVKKGDVLCIIEAMKIMNEILAEDDGEIVDVCAANGDIVEFSQTLFKLC